MEGRARRCKGQQVPSCWQDCRNCSAELIGADAVCERTLAAPYSAGTQRSDQKARSFKGVIQRPIDIGFAHGDVVHLPAEGLTARGSRLGSQALAYLVS
jgi:hypothetical protein